MTDEAQPATTAIEDPVIVHLLPAVQTWTRTSPATIGTTEIAEERTAGLHAMTDDATNVVIVEREAAHQGSATVKCTEDENRPLTQYSSNDNKYFKGVYKSVLNITIKACLMMRKQKLKKLGIIKRASHAKNKQ